MARGKKNAGRGAASRGRGGPSRGRGGRGGRGGGRGGYQSYSSGYQTPDNGILSMVQTARETGSHDHKAWGSTSLRTQPVMFVSAGSWDPKNDMHQNGEQGNDDVNEIDDETADRQPVSHGDNGDEMHTVEPPTPGDVGRHEQDIPATAGAHEPDGDIDEATDEDLEIKKVIEAMVGGQTQLAPSVSPPVVQQSDDSDVPDKTTPQEQRESFGFFFDTDKRPNEQEAKPSLAEPEPLADDMDTDSSDEVILFKGRDAAKRKQHEQTKTENLSMVKVEEEITFVESQMRQEGHKTCTHTRTDKPAPDTLEITTKKSKRQRKKREDATESRHRRKSVSSDDDLIADYIENMRATGEDQDLLALLQGNTRDIGGSDNAEVLFSEPSDSDSEEIMMDLDTLEDADTVSESSDDEWPSYEALAAEEGDGAGSMNSKRRKKKNKAKQHAQHDVSAEQEVEDSILAQIMEQLGSADDDDEEDDDDDDFAAWQVETLDTFDPMDWERPSLRRKKGKGNKARLQLDLSDSDLEQTLQAAWKTDRMKKAERKKQREEMRALGLLGKNAKPEDLRVKYPSGMGIEQVGEELRLFLESSKEQIELPPMDKHARKMVHELANKFNVKSKSTGDGSNRRPTLYKSKRTRPYAERTFDQVMSRMQRKFLPRLDAKRRPGAPRTMGQGRVSHAAATVRDGEMVGAAAPELGIDNRGRAMLEKMGWSKGTALGALDNKGILQPVSHAMKRTKAGLA